MSAQVTPVEVKAADEPEVSVVRALIRWDSGWYGDIAENGYRFTPNLRADLRGDYAGVGNNDHYFGTVLGNLYFDIPTSSMITPYLGAGVGYGWAEDDAGRNTDGFTYALTAGAAVDLTDNLAADVGYRFRQIVSGDGAHDHEVLVGLRYKF